VISELKRRKVFHVAAAYVVAGLLVIQVAETTFLHLPLPGRAVPPMAERASPPEPAGPAARSSLWVPASLPLVGFLGSAPDRSPGLPAAEDTDTLAGRRTTRFRP